jgi:formylglycine-generating enzyme
MVGQVKNQPNTKYSDSSENLRMRFLTILTLLLTGFIGTNGRTEEPNLVNLGIASTKPTSGPSVEVDGKFMVPYQLIVPGTTVKVEMIPIPGGISVMGSAEKEDESPVVQIKVGPMWVAKTETTWREYTLYMEMNAVFSKLASQGKGLVTTDNEADAVTAPTPLYEPSYTYEFGQDPDLPAVTMTQFAAKQYTKWLSKLTGRQYRLPTEAEWEYACRAGSMAAFCFGDEEGDLSDYGWFADNADEKPHPVAQKKPNAFGLYDMHGNVMEWTVNGYTEDGYQALASKAQPISFLDSVVWPKNVEGRVLRGGSWQDFAPECRAAARFASGKDKDWKGEDPNLPLSPWWYTTDPTRGVGFRIFRSYQPIDGKTLEKFWEIDHQFIREDVEDRLRTGRGIKSVVEQTLATEIEEHK